MATGWLRNSEILIIEFAFEVQLFTGDQSLVDCPKEKNSLRNPKEKPKTKLKMRAKKLNPKNFQLNRPLQFSKLYGAGSLYGTTV